ncbi:MAG: NC domain protein [Candidatus Epulonipiscioides saccharophilum]|nr:MAG: NC domain protein [Epulopiscium sp. AS2M-Bin001]
MTNIVANPTINTIVPSEIWSEVAPKKGDHIRVKRGVYSHHGVYVSDDEVIHFAGVDDDNVLDWANNEVIKTDLKQFLRGGILEVKEYTDEELDDLYPVEQIVAYARTCLGDKEYNLAFNNCEHFANMCTLGRFRSRQIEKVLMGQMPLEEVNKMGFFGNIGRAIGNWLDGGGSGGGSRSTTTYEPDKVKFAEIERDTKIQLAHMENERIEIMKNARLDILEFETQSAIAIEQAKAQGLHNMAQIIVELQDKLNEVAQKRLMIIEQGSLQIIKEIENFYSELNNKIQNDDDEYNTTKLPQLLNILGQYQEDSPQHKLYYKRIEEDMMMQMQYHTMQLNNVATRQTQVMDGFIKGKDKIIEQTGNITNNLLENISKKVNELENNTNNMKALENTEMLTAKPLQLSDAK